MRFDKLLAEFEACAVSLSETEEWETTRYERLSSDFERVRGTLTALFDAERARADAAEARLATIKTRNQDNNKTKETLNVKSDNSDEDTRLFRVMLARLVADARSPYGVSTTMRAIEDHFSKLCSDLRAATSRVRQLERVDALYALCEEYALEIDALEEELERNRQQLVDVGLACAEARLRCDELSDELEATDRELFNANSESDTLYAENRELRATLDRVRRCVSSIASECAGSAVCDQVLEVLGDDKT